MLKQNHILTLQVIEKLSQTQKLEFKPTYFYQTNAGRIAPNLTKKEIKKHINVFDFKNNIDFTFFP